MDTRTGQILAVLDSAGASMLLALLEGPLTEAELLSAAGEPGQSTGNRRLHRLREAGLVTQERGKSRAPGRQWSLIHPAEIEALLDALLKLVSAVDLSDRQLREAAAGTLKRARAQRLGIHRVQPANPQS